MRVIMALLTLFMAAPLAFAALSGPSPIPAPPNFYISSRAAMLCSGQVNNIPINIMDSGAASPQMQSVVLGIGGAKGVYLVGNGTVNAGNVNPNTSKTAYLPVFVGTNTSSLFSLGVSINYYFDTLYSDSETRNITFAVGSCPSPLGISVNPNSLAAGGIENVSVSLSNVGRSAFSSVVLRMSLPGDDGALLSRQPMLVGTIAPGVTRNITGSLFVYKNASQLVPLNVTATFYNGTMLNQVSDNIEMLTSGRINMTSSGFATSPALPSAGSIFSVSFVLTDIGTAGASAVTATPVLPAGFSSYGSNSVFIGDIGVDSQTPVTVSIEADGSVKQGTYHIPIKLNYLNGIRQNMTAWANASVVIGASAFNATQARGVRVVHPQTGGGIVVIALLLAVIVLAVLFFRERRRNRK